MDSTIFFNPVLVSIILLCILCLCKVNVLLSIMISAIAAGICAKMNLTEIMNTFISGMGNNSETALSYVLLGAFAAAMTQTGLADILAKKISKLINNNSFLLFFILTIIAMMSQNLIPVHIAFIPILIPPLLNIMNVLKIDRRAVACCLTFGLKMPYIVIPAGFGLIFQGLIADNMVQNGMNIAISEVWKYTIILGLGMFIALLIAVFISYRKPRIYNDVELLNVEEDENTKLTKQHYITLFAAFATLIVQLLTKSLPLGALVGLGIIFGTGTIKHHKMDNLIDEGVGLMGYIAFVMLVAAGFAAVLKSTGGIETFVNSVMSIIPANKLIASALMLLTGLFITIGIGTSFGTIPILAVIFVPVCISLNFNPAQTVAVLAAAAALGDAGSPASDTTLGPTAGLNADGQHSHIWDTCIPTFLHYNLALILFALISVLVF
ncbi:TRAP transporter large permease subunit [bacterium]|nr:TRAP transporter large permease subunit [bacterium]